MLNVGKRENIITKNFVALYRKFMIDAPSGAANGKKKLKKKIISPAYMKIVINGETIIVATIPIGEKFPIVLNAMGDVNVCAAQLAPKLDAMLNGRIFSETSVKKSEKSNIPARAP